MEEINMKTWNAPEVKELNINETANGFFNVNWEGPFDVICGDYGDKSNNSDSTADTNQHS